MENWLGRQIGTGGACDVYEYGQDKVIKLYFDGYSMYDVQREFNKTLKVWEHGLPAPRPYETVEINGRFGLVMERVYGDTFKDKLFRLILGAADTNTPVSDLMNEPEISGYIRKTAEALYMLHTKTVEGLNEMSGDLKWAALHNRYLTAEEGAAVCKLIDTLSKGDRLCHGDPNPGNLIDQQGKTVIVDWVSCGIGNPMCDLAEYVLMFRYAVLPEEIPPRIQEFVYTCKELIIDRFLEEYREISGTDISEVEDWLIPMAVSKLRATAILNEQKDRMMIFIREKLCALMG